MKKLQLFILLFSISLVCHSQRYCCYEKEVGIDGYDLVSYYAGDGILKGSTEYSAEYNGVTLHFNNQANLDMFESQPEYYFPKYGGWCAIAMSLGSLVKPNYTYYILDDDELLFFTIQGFVNGITLWNQDPEENKRKANANYSTIK